MSLHHRPITASDRTMGAKQAIELAFATEAAHEDYERRILSAIE